jgi:hypothetical protein
MTIDSRGQRIFLITIALICLFGLIGSILISNRASTTVEQWLKEIKNGENYETFEDYEKLNPYRDIFSLNDYEAQSAFSLHFKYNIIDNQQSGKQAKVRMKVSAVDMLSAIDGFYDRATSEQLMMTFDEYWSDPRTSEGERSIRRNQLLLNALRSGKMKKVSRELDVKLIKRDGVWEIQSDRPLRSAISGDLLSPAVPFREDDTLIADTPPLIKHQLYGQLIYVTDYVWLNQLKSLVTTVQDDQLLDFNDWNITNAILDLKNELIKKVDYDEFVASLDGEQYADVRRTWQTLSTELTRLHELILANDQSSQEKIKAFDGYKFREQVEAYVDAVVALKISN